MKKDRPKNVAASVRHRLMDRARKQGEDFQLVLTHFSIERFLYRLSRTDHANEFILKGAMLFRLWGDLRHRPTRDLDLLGKGKDSIEHLVEVLKTVCTVQVEDDGLVFDPGTVRGERIREDQEYEGVRLHCAVRLGQARIDLQIDVGFGDAVTPVAEQISYPAILDFPAPVLRAYPKETVVAEKFQAMVALGIANSRMKDFFDLWVLSQRFSFDGPSLSRAINATFRRRKTALPTEPPLALTEEFGADPGKSKQWEAFVKRGKLDASGNALPEICSIINTFLMPPTLELVGGRPFDKTWPQGGPWA